MSAKPAGSPLATLTDLDPRRCAVYARKSNSKGLDQRLNSIDAQFIYGKDFIESRPAWTIAPDAFYGDGGKKGPTLNRPAFQRLMRDATAGKFDTVLVYKIDRLARSILAFADIERHFKPLGVRFVFITEDFADDPNGRLTRNMRMSISEYERDIGIQRTSDKIAVTRKQGLWAGGQIPLGYDAKDKRLIVSPFEAKTVREIFSLYLQHRSAGAVAKLLRTRGYHTKERKFKTGTRSARTWTKAAVLSVLRNPIYTGQMEHGGELYPGLHESIVDRAQFEQAAALLRQNAIEGETHGENPDYFLRGVLRCATTTIDGTPCGHAFAPGSTRKGGVEFRYYRCTGREKMGADVCPCKSLPADAIEAYVTAQIEAAASDPEFVGRLRAELARARDYRARLTEHRAALAARAGQLAKEGQRLADAMQRADGASRTIYEHRINEIAADLQRTNASADRAELAAEQSEAAEKNGAWIVEQLSQFGRAWDLLNSANRALLVGALVEDIHVNEQANAIEIVFAPFGRDLPPLFFGEGEPSEAPPEPLRATVRETLFRIRGRSVSFADRAPVARLPVRRPAKVARMLALAHHLDRALKAGEFEDRRTVARYLQLTPARVTYVLQLTLLAPDIQEQILFLHASDGREPLAERALRPIVRAGSWARQRELWARSLAPLLAPAKAGDGC